LPISSCLSLRISPFGTLICSCWISPSKKQRGKLLRKIKVVVRTYHFDCYFIFCYQISC
jgi:hypothetical protein